MIGVVVVTYHSGRTLAACLASVPRDVPVVVVDNASADDTCQVARSARPDVALVQAPHNLGFGTACNLGARELPGHDLLFLNPDACLEPGALEALMAVLGRDEQVGAVGPAILDAAGVLEWSWGEDASLLAEWTRRGEHHQRRREAGAARAVGWVTGGCCLVRRAAFEAVRGFDERYFLYFEDLDLCRRLRGAGYRVWFEPAARARHARGGSAHAPGAAPERHYRESQLYYYDTHAPAWERVGLRIYLMLKYGWRALRDPAMRPVARAVWDRARSRSEE